MSLPDLTVRYIHLQMEGMLPSGCYLEYLPYDIGVPIYNSGNADAGFFAVSLNGRVQEVREGLPAGELLYLVFSGTDPSGHYVAIVDIYEQVSEINEGNNSRDFHSPTATAPPLCTNTPDPAEPEGTEVQS